MVFLKHTKLPEYAYSLDEEGVCKAAFELFFSFDEVISLGHKESVTVAQVKQYCEMESHEEKLYKLVQASKINETKDIMKRKALEIEKTKVFILFFCFSCHYMSFFVNFLYKFDRLKRTGVIKEDICHPWVLEDLKVASMT